MNNQAKISLKFFSPAIFFIAFSIVLCILCGETTGWICLLAGLITGGIAGLILPTRIGLLKAKKETQGPSVLPLLILVVLLIVLISFGGVIASWLRNAYPSVYRLFSGGSIFIIAAMNIFFLFFTFRLCHKNSNVKSNKSRFIKM